MEKKRKIFIAMLVMGFLLIGSIVLMVKHKIIKEISLLKPIGTKKITEDLYCVATNFSNFYLLKTDNGYIAFDGGMDNNEAEREMKKLGISKESVIALFLTHTDRDHIAAVTLFKNATIYISDKEEDMINGKVGRFGIYKNSITGKYKTLKDGEILVVDNTKIKLVLTPGHTIGSASFIVNDKYLFTGDTLSLDREKIKVFVEFFNMNTEEQKESIKKLNKYKNYKYILTAHFGYIERNSDSFKLIINR